MIFSSLIFILKFLPITFVGNLLIPEKYSNIFLLLASLFFYAWGEPKKIVVLLFSIVFNWKIGLIIKKQIGQSKKVFLLIGIISNLGILVYFKYLGFFVSIINTLFGRELITINSVGLPIGISFFTFQALSYLVDVYKGDVEPAENIVNVAMYISFFPQLVAGPIVKYKDINKQIENRKINWINVSDGFRQFIYGLGKKVLISNVLGSCVDIIHSYNIAEIDCKTAWIGAIAYTFQIYYDFSGYSDMAIGLAKMFGFNIAKNFDYPYLSNSITQFWRKWHISLGSWFKEYVYIPLGGNRKSELRTYLNLIVVFFLTGLWHGANVSFIIWGLFHGFFSVIERIGFKKILDKKRIFSTIYTFFIVNIGWVLFRVNDIITGIRYISRMLIPWRHKDIGIEIWNYMDNKTVFILVCAVLGAGIMNKIVPEKIKSSWKNSVIESIYCVCILILCLAALAGDTYNPFIYFQF